MRFSLWGSTPVIIPISVVSFSKDRLSGFACFVCCYCYCVVVFFNSLSPFVLTISLFLYICAAFLRARVVIPMSRGGNAFLQLMFVVVLFVVVVVVLFVCLFFACVCFVLSFF